MWSAIYLIFGIMTKRSALSALKRQLITWKRRHVFLALNKGHSTKTKLALLALKLSTTRKQVALVTKPKISVNRTTYLTRNSYPVYALINSLSTMVINAMLVNLQAIGISKT